MNCLARFYELESCPFTGRSLGPILQEIKITFAACLNNVRRIDNISGTPLTSVSANYVF